MAKQTQTFAEGRRKNEQINRLIKTLVKMGDFRVDYLVRVGDADFDSRIIINHSSQGLGDRIMKVNLGYQDNKLTGIICKTDYSHPKYDLSSRTISKNPVDLSLEKTGKLTEVLDIDDFICHIKLFSELPQVATSLSRSIANYVGKNRAFFKPNKSFKKEFFNNKFELMLCSPLDNKSGVITYHEPYLSVSFDNFSSEEIQRNMTKEIGLACGNCSGAEKYYALDDFDSLINELKKE